MKLVAPLFQPSGPAVDRYSRSSSSTISGSGPGLERRPSPAELISRSTDMEERGGEGGRRETVYVAVGRSEVKTFTLLQWTLCTFRNSQLCLVHVHQPSPFIPTLLGKLPASQANGEVVSAYRREEKEKMKKLLRTYFNICFKAKVEVSTIITEAEQVQKGLVDLVVKQKIQKLVMGSVPDNCMKLKRSSTKANYTVKNAPAFCEIWFIYKGKHMWTREAFEEVTTDPDANAYKLRAGRSRSESLQYNRSECPYNPDHLCSNSSRLSMQSCGVIDCIQNERTEEEWLLPHTSCSSADVYNNCYALSSTSFDPSSATSGEMRISSYSDYKLEEEDLFCQLLEAKDDSEKLSNRAFVELLKRKKLEAEAMQAIRKVIVCHLNVIAVGDVSFSGTARLIIVALCLHIENGAFQ